MFSSLLANETKAVGPVVSHEEAASRFDKIEVHGPFQVQFTVGASTPVKIEAQKEIVDATEVKVEGDTLVIRFAKPVHSDKPIMVTLGGPNLRGIVIDGACQFRTDGRITGPVQVEAAGASKLEAAGNLEKLQADGASTVNFTDIAVAKLRVLGDGASTALLTGEVGDLTVDVSGASTVKPGLRAKSASIRADGASSAQVSVAESLTAQANGASSIRYSGKATQVVATATGGSTVSRID